MTTRFQGLGIGDRGLCAATAITLGSAALYARIRPTPTMRPTGRHDPRTLRTLRTLRTRRVRRRADRMLVEDRSQRGARRRAVHAHADVRGARHRASESRRRRVGLAPSALHLVPFDIVGGERFRDILKTPRRFFQYQYTMRVLGEEFFGKEVTLPRLQISYRVQNSLQGGAALAGTRSAVFAAYRFRFACCRSCRPAPTTSATRRSIPSATWMRVCSGRICC